MWLNLIQASFFVGGNSISDWYTKAHAFLYMYRMGIEREVLWNFKISWQTWIQEYFLALSKWR